MRINNNFNVLPFYDSLQKQNSKKWYSFGQHYPLICPNNKLLPFQFVTNEELTITGNIVAVNVTTGQTTDLGVKPGVMLGTQPGAQYYIVKLAETAINKSLEGLHYLQISTNKGYIYSEEFVFTDSYSECVRLEYWNEDTLNFTSGEINFDDDFKFVMYISSTIGKPEYEFEEELTKRLGYKFIESQTSNKIYKFNFLAPEYICDAMRLVRMCDYIKLTTKYDTYNALSFSYEPKWQNNGDLAAVDVEFDTDCIIQKLESFNRRLKESFYNALLADIDEPVLFSNDTVAQYYTEFTTTSYINGKLIRQLEAISEDELSQSINDIVLPIDNQSDTNQVAKKVFLSNIINKFAPQVDLSKYLLKSVWDSVFELRDDIETGKRYIYGKLPVVLQYGLTMYSGDGVDIPSIYEGLPIDNDTIYWKDGILKAKAGAEGTITEITSSMVTSALGYTPYDASNPNGYITSAALANYALTSDVAAVSSKLNDFLEGSDTDNIINKWKELETFLSGLSQSDNLATILGNKAEKTDLAKYIPIAGATDITGEKNFIGGLKVNGSPIYYDTENKYWKLEGDLLVTGGVTIYGNDSEFVASTIMDAILYDDSTLGINSQGQLYVKGGTGGAATMGSLSNVGSWADSVASQDRIMYQAANSSQWVAKNLSDLAVGGVTGDYLPLSGGTIKSTAVPQLILQGESTDAYITFKTTLNTADSAHSGLLNLPNIGASASFGVSDRIVFPFSGGMYYRNGYNGTNQTIWHSGNDGNGSGLDADLLDGKHYSDIINGNVASATRLQAYQHNSGENVLISGSRTDNTSPRYIYDNGWGLCLRWQEGNGVVHNGTIATLNDNVASATKLATARTIWGQSFDGTGNVDGLLSISEGSNSNSRATINLVTISNNPCDFYLGANNIKKWSITARHSDQNYALAIYNATTAAYPMWIDAATNNVGIGTTTPTLPFSIVATRGDVMSIKTTSDTWNCIRYYPKSGTNWSVGCDTNNKFFFFSDIQNKYVAEISANGDFLVNGGITMYSDARKKTILNHVELSLQQVSNAPLIEHYYNSDQNKTTHVGSIAQYWAEMNDWFCKLDNEGYYTMEIQNAALASAISVARELVKFETETDKRIRLLEEENKRLKEEVEYLKLNIA